MPKEVELKLRLTPADLNGLRAHLIEAMASEAAKGKQTLVNRYFDTPDHQLRQQGACLRIRKQGDRYIQTLKVSSARSTSPETEFADAVHSRFEFDTELVEDQLVIEGATQKRLKNLLKNKKQLSQLKPVFITEFQRETFNLSLANSTIEIALDKGKIYQSAAQVELCEAELELLSGEQSALYELALKLIDVVPFVLEQSSKAARGYQLGLPVSVEATKATAIKLNQHDRLGEGFPVICRACLAQLRANEAAFEASDDPEIIHQMRVAVRRLRALISLFKPVLSRAVFDYLTAELRWLQNELGMARDWDVFLLETAQPLLDRFEGLEECETLIQHASIVKQEAYARARHCIASPRYTRLLLKLYCWLEKEGWYSDQSACFQVDLRYFANRAISRREKILRRLGKKQKTMTDADLHQVRIAGKKLRYAIEFFEAFYPVSSVNKMIQSLKALQDSLGSLNDAVTAHRLMEELYGYEGKCGSASYLIGLVDGWLAAQAAMNLEGFSSAWSHYLSLKPLSKTINH